MVLREAQLVGLTDAQRDLFERDGYLVVEDALDTELVPRLTDAIDRVWWAHRDAPPSQAPIRCTCSRSSGAIRCSSSWWTTGRSYGWWSICSGGTSSCITVTWTYTRRCGEPRRARGCGTRTAASRTTTWRPTRAHACR